MAIAKRIFLLNKANIIYGAGLAGLLLLLKWLEIRFILWDRSYEIYTGMIALGFMVLGAWFAIKLSMPGVKTVVIEKEVLIEQPEKFLRNNGLIAELQLSKRELAVLNLLAKGHSNGEIASELCVSLSTVKAHNQNLFEKLDAKRRTQAVEKARRLRLIP